MAWPQLASRFAVPTGLVIQLGGFLFDEYYHGQNLSLVPIGPSTLLWVHGGIYVGLVVVLAGSVVGLASSVTGGGAARWAVGIVLIGAVVELLGAAADMFTHSRGYESDVYHGAMYFGAAMAVAGYLLSELIALRRPARAGSPSTENRS